MDLHCSRCGEARPESEFSPQPSNGTRGRSQWCKPCNAAYARERYKDPKRAEAARERARRRREKPEVKAMISEYNIAYRKANPELMRRLDNDPDKRERDRAARRTEKGRMQGVVRAERRRARMANGPGVSEKEWLDRLADFNGRCAYCLLPGRMTMEHMTPISRGGLHAIENVVPACGTCNSRKGTRNLLEFVGVL